MEAALDLELLFPVHTSHLCKESSTDKSKVEREAKRRDTFFLSFSPSNGLTLHIMESLGVPHAPIWERVHQRCLEGDWDLSLKSTPQGLRSIIAANSHALLLLLCRLHYTTVRERLHPRRQPGRSCGQRPDAAGGCSSHTEPTGRVSPQFAGSFEETATRAHFHPSSAPLPPSVPTDGTL